LRIFVFHSPSSFSQGRGCYAHEKKRFSLDAWLAACGISGKLAERLKRELPRQTCRVSLSQASVTQIKAARSDKVEIIEADTGCSDAKHQVVDIRLTKSPQ